ncbi:MAG: hypothetical protein WCX28_06060 [Bacteriovoracaceae bacterium]|nr:hypothetical protein [Bacteroidota bacterium]
MKDRTKTFVSVALLIIYGTLALVSVPLHFHQDVMLSSGTGSHTFAQHEDALHCEHHAIESHTDCTLCSTATHFHYSSVIAIVPLIDSVIGEHAETFQHPLQQCFHSVLSRRGPPILLA